MKETIVVTRLKKLLASYFSEATIPFAFLAFLFLDFGLLLPSLGIYQDDWVFVNNAFTRGAPGLWRFMYYDGTPFASLIITTAFSVLGFRPLVWHVASLVARWLAVVIFWKVLKEIWPSHPRETFLVALVFALHPFFTLQPLAFTYLHVWIGYFTLGLSFYWMILSIRQPRRFWLYTFLGLLAEIVTILTLEYFAGLEFLRPILLWMVLDRRQADVKRSLWRVFRLWGAYLAVLGIYIYWRLFVFVAPDAHRNPPVLLYQLLQDSIGTLRLVFSNLVPDSLIITITSWFKIIDPDWFNLELSANQLLFLFMGLVGFLLFFYLERQQYKSKPSDPDALPWMPWAFWLGLAIVIAGLIPPYVGGLFINEKNPLWSSRLGLASTLGASILAVVFTGALGKHRNAFISVLLCLAIGANLRSEIGFQRSWEKQLDFYWQLYWRAPYLEPHTLLVSDGEFLFYMGVPPTVFALNTLYPPSAPSPELSYWVSAGTEHMPDWDLFRAGVPLKLSSHGATFEGQTTDSLTMSFLPEQGQCLWILRPRYGAYPFLGSNTLASLPVSSLSRIRSTPLDEWSPPREIFGAEPPHSWCYFFEKADLAAQAADWEEAIRLFKEAQQGNLSPGHGVELFPFIRAYASLDQWNEAVSLTVTSSKISEGMKKTVCVLWAELKADTSNSSLRQDAFRQMNDRFTCGL